MIRIERIGEKENADSCGSREDDERHIKIGKSFDEVCGKVSLQD